MLFVDTNDDGKKTDQSTVTTLYGIPLFFCSKYITQYQKYMGHSTPNEPPELFISVNC